MPVEKRKRPADKMPAARALSNDFYEAIYRLVRDIPRGRVMTYGQIAAIIGMPRAARAVGFAMRMCGKRRIPWHRVINAQWRLSFPPDSEPYETQKHRLLQEGVTFRGLRVCPAADQTPSP